MEAEHENVACRGIMNWDRAPAFSGSEIIADLRDQDAGNSSHEYTILNQGVQSTVLKFQHGPVKEKGINGITNEQLLSVLIDRMEGFQSSRFSCRENAIVLTHLQDAAHWLNHRTVARLNRGVEGENKP